MNSIFYYARLVGLEFFSAISSWSSLVRFLFFWLKMAQQDFHNLWMLRLWLIETGMYVGCWDRDSLRLRNILDVKTETHRDWEISWMSRRRLIKTEIFLGCQDRDSSRVRNILAVETKTHRDWEIYWMSRPRPVETGQKMSIPRLHQDSRWSPRQYLQ